MEEVSSQFPSRYQPLSRLGSGGGGEVWEVADRYTKARYALKVLGEDASEAEMAALVREAVALSGLEGLGVPRVLRFGRLPGTHRPFMVREIVDGHSLEELISAGTASKRVLTALAGAAEQLTLIHRAGFLHGDVKPANVIVQDDGRATLVDLGLAARWRDSGSKATGLTPKYAAPELFRGGALTVRAEVFALGVALKDTIECAQKSLDASLVAELMNVAERATADEAEQRHPSADEFAAALRRAAKLPHPRAAVDPAAMWPILGIEATASRLLQSVIQLKPGQVLTLAGRLGAGRSVLLRRLAWSLGVEARPLVWVDEASALSSSDIQTELGAFSVLRGLTLLVDDAESLTPETRAVVSEAREQGACLVAVAEGSQNLDWTGTETRTFHVPAIGQVAAAELLKRAVPSLTPRTVQKLVEHAGGLPGELRRFVSLLAQRPVVSDGDVEALLRGGLAPRSSAVTDLGRALEYLDRGHYVEAQAALAEVKGGDLLVIAVAQARLHVGLGEGGVALDLLKAVEQEASERLDSDEGKTWTVWLARAYVSRAEYTTALELLARVKDEEGAIGAEALAFEGLALSHIAEHGAAQEALTRAVKVAEASGDAHVQGRTWTCLGLVHQRADSIEEAEAAYQQALTCAERASDASTLGTVQLNLAVLFKVKGDIARAIEHFEAAADMGRRSGRRATVRHALLNLANADLFLGRLDRARSAIERLKEQQDQLPASAAAQLLGLEAEFLLRSGETERAVTEYRQSADAWEEIGSAVEAAEALLEAVLGAASTDAADVNEMSALVARGQALLGDSSAHRPLQHLACARLAMSAGNETEARGELERSLEAAQQGGQKDWIWRVLEARAELEEQSGQLLSARRDRIEAVTVLEEIAARLPRDLREVFWNDTRRRGLRSQVNVALSSAPTQVAFVPHRGDLSARSSPISAFTQTPLEQRLAQLLEINRELLGELDLSRLTSKVITYAVELVQAQRGFVILREKDGELKVHSSSTREGDAGHLEFSRSIARQVLHTREPVVSGAAQQDSRLQEYASVHQMSLEGVVCVPILGRSGEATGALYVEASVNSGRVLERELPTLRAYADQVALAFETRLLVSENQRRAEELDAANKELTVAQARLKELLGHRTESLKQTRKQLRDARGTLLGHFGYQGMVGTSAAMRRAYSLIDRVKDTDVPILITGESGTGKEVAARAVHRGSERAKQPFLGVNCGAIPEHLLESELFGHVRGAFTGADKERRGIFRDAGGGTVLLDEIGEMPHKMQAGLLRVLQERKVRPVGGSREEAVDCRFVFATHRDLQELVAEGRFREDLYYRIMVVQLAMPALRERLDDIPLLVDHFLGIFAARHNRDKKRFTKAALRRLSSFRWPGNVRQLEHLLLNAWIMSDGEEIDAEDLELPQDPGTRPSAPPPSVAPREPAVAAGSRPPPAAAPKNKKSISSHRRSEKDRILEALEACNWNRVRAAELAGIPRRTFYRRLREYDIQ